MPRTAVNAQINHTDKIKIDQPPDIVLDDMDVKNRKPEFVEADASVLEDKEYADLLAFNEEPLTIRIEPSTEKNAATVHPVWCNGKGAECFINGRWREVTWLPVSTEIIIKRKYVAILAGAKVTSVTTEVIQRNEDEENRIHRVTSPLLSFSIIEDKNPRGHAWLTELRRRA